MTEDAVAKLQRQLKGHGAQATLNKNEILAAIETRTNEVLERLNAGTPDISVLIDEGLRKIERDVSRKLLQEIDNIQFTNVLLLVSLWLFYATIIFGYHFFFYRP